MDTGGTLNAKIGIILIVVLGILVLTPGAHAQSEKPFMCKKCGEPITGTYFETNGVYFHSHCFVCKHCGEPVKGAYTTYRGDNYHTDCFEDHVAKRCALCDGIIQGEYLFDFWGNAYHLAHQNETETCEYC